MEVKYSFVAENKFFSETVRRLKKGIRHRLGRGIPSSSGHIGAAWKSLLPALHSVPLRDRMFWTFCDKQEPVTLDFFIPLLDAVSSPAGSFRIWSENFAAQPHSTVSISTQARIKPFLLPAPLAATNAFWNPFRHSSDFVKCVRELWITSYYNWNRSVTCIKPVPRSSKSSQCIAIPSASRVPKKRGNNRTLAKLHNEN